MGFVWFLVYEGVISFNSINQMMFVTDKCSVFFAARTQFLNYLDEFLRKRIDLRELETFRKHKCESYKNICIYLSK
jgi:hypothetical protein